MIAYTCILKFHNFSTGLTSESLVPCMAVDPVLFQDFVDLPLARKKVDLLGPHKLLHSLPPPPGDVEGHHELQVLLCAQDRPARLTLELFAGLAALLPRNSASLELPDACLHLLFLLLELLDFPRLFKSLNDLNSKYMYLKTNLGPRISLKFPKTDQLTSRLFQLVADLIQRRLLRIQLGLQPVQLFAHFGVLGASQFLCLFGVVSLFRKFFEKALSLSRASHFFVAKIEYLIKK